MKPRPHIGTEQERRGALAECLGWLAGAFGRTFDRHATEAYWSVLGELPPDRMRRAVRKALSEEKFCPPPAVIRQHARALPAHEAQQPREEKPFTPPTPEQWKEINALMDGVKRRCRAMQEENK
jgi:hypothetical protein